MILNKSDDLDVALLRRTIACAQEHSSLGDYVAIGTALQADSPIVAMSNVHALVGIGPETQEGVLGTTQIAGTARSHAIPSYTGAWGGDVP